MPSRIELLSLTYMLFVSSLPLYQRLPKTLAVKLVLIQVQNLRASSTWIKSQRNILHVNIRHIQSFEISILDMQTIEITRFGNSPVIDRELSQ